MLFILGVTLFEYMNKCIFNKSFIYCFGFCLLFLNGITTEGLFNKYSLSDFFKEIGGGKITSSGSETFLSILFRYK